MFYRCYSFQFELTISIFVTKIIVANLIIIHTITSLVIHVYIIDNLLKIIKQVESIACAIIEKTFHGAD